MFRCDFWLHNTLVDCFHDPLKPSTKWKTKQTDESVKPNERGTRQFDNAARKKGASHLYDKSKQHALWAGSDWLTEWLSNWLTNWLAVLLYWIGLTGWLTDWLADWLWSKSLRSVECMILWSAVQFTFAVHLSVPRYSGAELHRRRNRSVCRINELTVTCS